MLREPLLHPGLFGGIRDHWQLLIGLHDAPGGLEGLEPPAADADADTWIAWALEKVDAPEFSVAVPDDSEASWWLTETRQRIHAVVQLVRDYMPWLLPQFAPLFALPALQGLRETAIAVQTGAASGLAADLDARIAKAASGLAANAPEAKLAQELRRAIIPARESLRALTMRVARPGVGGDAFCYGNGLRLPDGSVAPAAFHRL